MGEGKRESSRAQKGKGKATQDHPGHQRKSPTTWPGKKGKGKRPASTTFDPIPLGNQTARTHARTKRNDFLVEHPPTSDRFREAAGDISDTEQLANKYVLPKSIVDDCKDQLFGGCESVGLNFTSGKLKEPLSPCFGSQRTSFGSN